MTLRLLFLFAFLTAGIHNYAQTNPDGTVDYTWLNGKKRGNSSRNDTYYSIMVRAEYTIKVTKQKGHTINRVYSPKFKSRRK